MIRILTQEYAQMKSTTMYAI